MPSSSVGHIPIGMQPPCVLGLLGFRGRIRHVLPGETTSVTRVSIPELVVALQSGAPLRDALASALRDEELTVLYWLDQRQGTSRGGWVDPQGHAVPEPEPRAGRAVKVVEQDGRRPARAPDSA